MKLKEIRVSSTKNGWGWTVTPLEEEYDEPSLSPTKLIYHAPVEIPDEEAAKILLDAMIDITTRKIKMMENQIAGLLRAKQKNN